MRIASETHAWQSFYLLFIFVSDFLRAELGFLEHAVGVEVERLVQAAHRRRSLRAVHHDRQADGDVEMARMLIWFSPSVENARAATPGDDFMPVPTRLTFAISSSTS